MSKMKIQIISPSSPSNRSILSKSLQMITNKGFKTAYKEPNAHKSLDILSASRTDRASELQSALSDPKGSLILSSRGGYGASELLDALDWDAIGKSPPKLLVGFSDITALQSALFSKLSWTSLHAPMPGTSYWGHNSEEDLELLFAILKDPQNAGGSLKIERFNKSPSSKEGTWIFGGCMSVLANLIGTPYFPQSLKNAFLFLEDIGENPGRLLRTLNHFILSTKLDDIAGIIFGDFGDNSSLLSVLNECKNRIPCSIYLSTDFGHKSPNFPIGIGAKAKLQGNALHWAFGDLR